MDALAHRMLEQVNSALALSREYYQFVPAALAAIDSVGGPDSAYARAEKNIPPRSRFMQNEHAEYLKGILQSLAVAVERGYLKSAREVIHGEVFGDFLEQADYLLDPLKLKDPAAVIAGSALESHLRALCDKHGIPITYEKDGAQKRKTADTLNSNLCTANAYSKLDQKSVTAWQDLRNKAAHGQYDEYQTEQVALMIQGIRDFIVRNPA